MRSEGKPYDADRCPLLHRRHGAALCSCGELSEVLSSDRARQEWHRAHKLRVLTAERRGWRGVAQVSHRPTLEELLWMLEKAVEGAREEGVSLWLVGEVTFAGPVVVSEGAPGSWVLSVRLEEPGA